MKINPSNLGFKFIFFLVFLSKLKPTSADSSNFDDLCTAICLVKAGNDHELVSIRSTEEGNKLNTKFQTEIEPTAYMRVVDSPSLANPHYMNGYVETFNAGFSIRLEELLKNAFSNAELVKIALKQIITFVERIQQCPKANVDTRMTISFNLSPGDKVVNQPYHKDQLKNGEIKIGTMLFGKGTIFLHPPNQMEQHQAAIWGPNSVHASPPRSGENRLLVTIKANPICSKKESSDEERCNLSPR